MYAIHKYILPMMEEVTIEMPVYPNCISAEMQEGFICVWALVDKDQPMAPKKFRLYKTGQDIHSEVIQHLRYIGIAKIHVGQDLGMHVFEYLAP